jgi:putative ABC transport system substrate-binding protein
MRRREFFSVLGGAAAAWPVMARAQRRGIPTIGLLGSNTPSTQAQWTEAFVKRLRELGWIEGSTVAIEVRWADGRNQRYAEIAAEFVKLKVDVIITSGTEPVVAARQATSGIPIVFATAGDPVASGLIASLARPGGNITGLSIQSADLAGKRLELLREVVPNLQQVAIMANAGNPVAVLEIGQVQTAAKTLGLQVSVLDIKRAEDIAPAFKSLKVGVGALYVQAEPLTTVNAAQIGALARAVRLPTMHGNQGSVEVGGLMSYAPYFPDLWRRAAEYVDKILRGARPGEIPVEQPTKFKLVFNLKTAKALGLTIPESFLLRADEVIE